jgi:hypothetical protein
MENKDKKGFGRLMADLQSDTFHDEFMETVEHLPKSKNRDLDSLRERLRNRYKRHRLSPTAMYLPRIALTFAILMTCAVSIIYIQKIKNQPQKPKTTPSQIDSLIKNRQKD